MRLLQQYPALHVDWVVFSASQARAAEAQASAQDFLGEAASRQITVHDFADGHFPYLGSELKRAFEKLKQATEPDLIFTHYLQDRHQDHRTLSELTWNTFRDHLVLEYEIPKYDGDLGTPNCFIALPDDLRERKVAYLLKHFGTQANRHWFAPETFNALMRIRGVESRAPSLYAEAFHCRKFVV